MIASAAETKQLRSLRLGAGLARAIARGCVLSCALLSMLGCAGVTPTPQRPLAPLPVRAARAPDAADYAARELAQAVLVSDASAAQRALDRLEAIDAERRSQGGAATGVVPYARDTGHALLDDAGAWHRASRELLKRRDLEPALRARLEQETDDHPLRLAERRLGDARLRSLGGTFNALVEPLGRSLLSGGLLPLRVAQALVGVAVREHLSDELSTPERQALEHWKTFIERNPDAPETAALLARVEESQRRWYRTQRDENVRAAERALEQGHAELALARAERALRYAPEDRRGLALLAEAQARVAQQQADRRRSLGAAEAGSLDLGGAELARALLLSTGTPPQNPLGEAARRLQQNAAGSSAAAEDASDELAFVAALAESEAGEEEASWRTLEGLARLDTGESNMARHARALLRSPEQNPYRAYRIARRAQRNDRLRWLALGPLAQGPRELHLPRPVEWLAALPSVVQTVLGLPNRLIRLPFARATRRSPAVFARRYLERHPQGEHAGELRAWLQRHEGRRGNHVAALRLAEADPHSDPKALAALRERAASQALAATEKEKRLDARIGLLRRVSVAFEGTEDGLRAAERLAEELTGATAQQIRLSRAFLREYPELTGVRGLALRPGLLDEALDNGELHSEGITLLGGRVVEFAFVAASGREQDPPVRTRRRISDERLARLAALLEETAQHTARVDPEMAVGLDPDRDLFFERARLGIADDAPPRASAQSHYIYEGSRERYGVVRSRESILPVELVLQGSFDDFGMGAFPRIRMPKETPDAFLYR